VEREKYVFLVLGVGCLKIHACGLIEDSFFDPKLPPILLLALNIYSWAGNALIFDHDHYCIFQSSRARPGRLSLKRVEEATTPDHPSSVE
jgi:hypothetical protein